VHRKRTILWGLLLIGIGLFLLLQSSGAIPEDVEVWPLILVAIGVWLLLERLLFGGGWGGGYVWPILFIAAGTLLFLQDLDALPDEDVFVPVVVIALGVGLTLSAISQARGAPEEQVSIPLDGATEASIRLDHGAGRLRMTGMLGGSELVRGRFVGGVRTNVQRSGDRLDLSLRSRPGGWHAGAREGGLEWNVEVNRQVPLTLDLNTGASDTDLDLTHLRVAELAISTGASKTVARLPSTGRYVVRIKGGAASVFVHVPERVAARIGSRGGLSNVRVDERRFPRWGSEWRSADFEDAEHRADISLDVGAASVEIG
jgi:hypothetical protein